MSKCRRPDCGKELPKVYNLKWCKDDPVCQAHRKDWKDRYNRAKQIGYRKARGPKGKPGGFRAKSKKEVIYSDKWVCIYEFCPERGKDGRPQPFTLEEVEAGHRWYHKECHSAVSDQCADYGTPIILAEDEAISKQPLMPVMR